MNNNLTSLFLSQSYQDTWDDYYRSITIPGFVCWDYVVLTASNDKQARAFEMQLAERKDAGILPPRTHFVVVPDRNNERIGSGGATLSVLKKIAETEGSSDFKDLRILVIHSGGDSKRVPQYSALGKLFSPVPHELATGRPATLFDEFMIAMSSVPARMKEGMLLCSGDVLLLFNPLQIDYSGEGAACISFKEDVDTGKNHGVFLKGEDGNVERFLHKQSVEDLRRWGAVNDNDCVDIDTGAVIFSSDMLSSLYGLISTDGEFDDAKYDETVNSRVRLSLYGDFLYPLATGATLEDFYKEKPEGEYCDELTAARKKIWDVLRPYRMKLLRLAPAKFIHFGTTAEILELMATSIDNYTDLGWKKKVNSSIADSIDGENKIAGFNSVLSHGAKYGKNCYLEVSYVHETATLGENVLLSHIDIYDEQIPSDVVIHGLKQRNLKFVARIFGTCDNPKKSVEDDATFLGTTLAEFIRINKLDESEIWKNGEEHTLWNATLYPECSSIQEAVKAALNIYDMARGCGDVVQWKSMPRKSLCSGFADADPEALIAWDKRMQELVCMSRIDKMISDKRPAREAVGILKKDELTKIQKEWLGGRFSKEAMDSREELELFGDKMRLHYYVGQALGGSNGEEQVSECFRLISQTILKSTLDNLTYNDTCRMVTDKHVVNLPLRVNFGGGWSDTPPYCCEQGGTVLNAAIKLNGKFPVSVALERTDEKKIVFDSRDMDVHGEFSQIEPLQRTGDPYDSFALQKAALLACGIIPKEGGSLEDILTRLGGGFIMRSEVTGVPKGSGLGTSSILSAACVKAIFEFMGIEHSECDLYSHVLCMEQIMSTGGGWQDQVGGVTPGIKYITSKPGLNQEIKVDIVHIPKEAAEELNERFALIYTGQRRLARNLLRDVVGRYVGNEPDSVYALNEIQRVAALMRFELERGNIDEFGKLLDYHWTLSQKVDAGSTNTLIDQILNSIDEFLEGRMICGAGGGGFLQVLLKKGVSKDMVHTRLKEVFADNPVDVWDCDIMF